VANLCQRAGLRAPQSAVLKGLRAVEWPGRFEILNHDPYLILDSAMNGDSAEILCHTLQEYLPGRDLTLIIGVSGDHEYRALLKALLPAAQRVFLTRSRHPRAAAPETLAAAAADLGFQVATQPTLSAALNAALDTARPRDVICVTGSLFCVADARETWFCHHNLPLPPIDPVIGDMNPPENKLG